MEFLLLLGLALVGLRVLALRDTRERIALLASHLQRHRIEPRMAQLIDGYLRAAGEPDPDRAQPVWQTLAEVEQALAGELAQLATDLQAVWGERMRVCRWPVAVPHATRFFPHAGYDFRALVQVHAQGFQAVLRNDEALPPRDRAFRATAELLLFQHSCHWYCRSRWVADARLLAAHKTPHSQVLASVAPATRTDYLALVNGRNS